MELKYSVGFWELDWLWGVPLVATSVAVHAVAVILMILLVAGAAEQRLNETRSRAGFALIFIGFVTALGFGLALLHAFHALVWAAAYLLLGAVEDFPHAIAYSFGMITTVGTDAGAVNPEWRLLGNIEAMAGMLLFGFSTAVLFAVLQRFWLLLRQRLDEQRAGPG